MRASTSLNSKSIGVQLSSSPRNSARRWRSISRSATATISLFTSIPCSAVTTRSPQKVNAGTDKQVAGNLSALGERATPKSIPSKLHSCNLGGRMKILGTCCAMLTAATLTAPTAAADPSNSGSSVYYPNCKAAAADGAHNIQQGQPGYRADLDRDGDGIACESP